MMANTAEIKADALPDLDDLLQCPVCYEIPSGQIFQCNEGHHVCGRCKARLDLCPVCRSLFFGTRNYAMEELIASVRKLQAFKLGGKMTVTSGSAGSESTASADNSDVAGTTEDGGTEDDHDFLLRELQRAPPACKGLFRCLCCKVGNAERLPAGRLLNHLRYFHAPNLLEGNSEGGEYVQAWQISTVPGRIVIAVRVSDMGVFFLVIEISKDCIIAWVSMAASPWVAHQYCYTLTVSGNDREAIFSDCVWSVRSCEGSLKKRGRCLMVNGLDVRALTATANVSGKLVLRRAPQDQVTHQNQPRAVLRVANRGAGDESPITLGLEPLIQGLQDDVARLSRAFASLGRDTDVLDLTDEVGVRFESRPNQGVTVTTRTSTDAEAQAPPPEEVHNEQIHLSRNARRRMRQRLRAALNVPEQHSDHTPGGQFNAQNTSNGQQRGNLPIPNNQHSNLQFQSLAAQATPYQNQGAAQPISGPSNGLPHNTNQNRAGKKKRRHRR